MAGILTILSAVFQVVLLLMNAHFSKEADVKAAKANQVKEISDAVASGDLSRINGVIGSLRSK